MRQSIKPAYKNWGVDRKFLPPKSIGYLNIKKKYRCPTRFPISSLMTLQSKRKKEEFHMPSSTKRTEWPSSASYYCSPATGSARAMSHGKFPFPQRFAATSLEGPACSANTSAGCSTLPSKPSLQTVLKMQLNACLPQGIRPYSY